MKLLFLTLIALSLFMSAMAQNSKEDIQQDIAELRNDVKDLEDEIADAKINSPEDIPELEKELAATKKMLVAFEKIAGISAGPQPTVTSTAPTANATTLNKSVNDSPIVPIKLDQPVKTPTPDQATDRLLWYSGKKINDSTLVTVKAMVVQFQPKRNRVIVQPNAMSDQFRRLTEELKKSEQRKDELIDKVEGLKNGTLYYPQLVFALKYYDDFDKRYSGVVNNSIDFKPGSAMASFEAKPSGNPGPQSSGGSGIDLSYLKEFKEALQEAEAKFKALPKPEDFPPPPEHEMGVCGECDKKIVKRERQQDSIWFENYHGKEAKILSTVFGVYRQAELLGIYIDENDPEIWSYSAAIASVLNRMSKKDNFLYKRYGKELKRCTIVSQAILSDERQRQLLGFADDNAKSKIPGLLSNIDSAYLAYYKEQKGLKNYNFVLDIAKHLGWERQNQLLGTREDGDNFFFNNVVLDAVNYNRFALTLDLDFVYERVDDDDKPEIKATGSISTKDKIYVRLSPDSCLWRMVLFDTDYRNANEQRAAIPLVAKSGAKTVRDQDDNLVTYNYSGPKDMVAYFPEFKIDLCDMSKMDSAFMMPINLPYGYTPASLNVSKSYKEDMIAIANDMFMDVNKMEGNESEGMGLAAEIVSNLSQSQVTEPTGNAKLDKMQGEYNLKLKQDSYKKNISNMGLNKKSVFLFNANNGSTVFIDQYNDTKHTIDEDTKLVKGQIHLRVVHDPNTNK